MSIVKALGIAAAPPGAPRIGSGKGQGSSAGIQLHGSNFRTAGAPAAPRTEARTAARIIPAVPHAAHAASTPAQASKPAVAEPAGDSFSAAASEAARLFTRQTLSAYAALLAGDDAVAGDGTARGPGQRPADAGPPRPPGSVLDISA